MAKDVGITVDGVVIDIVPGPTFKVQLENGHVAMCHPAGKIRTNNITIVANDRVQVNLSSYDLTRGRVIYRY